METSKRGNAQVFLWSQGINVTYVMTAKNFSKSTKAKKKDQSGVRIGFSRRLNYSALAPVVSGAMSGEFCISFA